MAVMPRVDQDAFDGLKLVRVYIALKVAEARRVEDVLDRHEIEFAVLVEPAGRSLFGGTRNGAVFCVAEDHGQRCADLLIAAGLDVGIVPQTPDDDEAGS